MSRLKQQLPKVREMTKYETDNAPKMFQKMTYIKYIEKYREKHIDILSNEELKREKNN